MLGSICRPTLSCGAARPQINKTSIVLAAAWLLAGAALAASGEPAVTVLADFEDPTVAPAITEVRNIPAGDCSAKLGSLPARGRGSLAVEIGATVKDVSVACDLTLREPVRFEDPQHAATFCWINEGTIRLAFRLHDAREQIFETPPQIVSLTRRWVRVGTDVRVDQLRRVSGDGPLALPVEVHGYRIAPDQLGKQTIYLDDLQMEHRVPPNGLIRGEFRFNEPTRIYEPGATIAAAVVLENQSRQQALSLGVELAWTRPDGSVLQTQNARMSLPASGNDYRSYQSLDFSQVIREPGLYRLVARARAAGWTRPTVFESSIAVAPSNRRLSRGRSVFFALQSNLLREPELDQMLEINVARDIGVNLLAFEAPWQNLQPKSGTDDLARLDTLVRAAADRDLACMLVLTDPPDWVGSKPADRAVALATLLKTLTARLGRRVQQCQLTAEVLAIDDLPTQLDTVAKLQAQLVAQKSDLLLLPPAIAVGSETPAPAGLAARLADSPLVFQTEGDPTAAAAALEDFRSRCGLKWSPSNWWTHRTSAIWGTGSYVDAEEVFRHYVRAANAGVGGLVWVELRDDDNDPRLANTLRGLVRRDFSPKAELLGYAAAAGLLTGCRCTGPLANTPDSLYSALFVGGGRQIAVLLPLPNRIPPAVIAPEQMIAGDLDAQDFDRRMRPLLTSSAPTLVTTIPRPLFVGLNLKQANPDPKLALARPWLRVPAIVFCGRDTEFTVEIEAPFRLQSSYVQLVIPAAAAVRSSFSAAALKADAGQTMRYNIPLSCRAASGEFERGEVTLRVSLEGENLDIPLEVRPLADILPTDAGRPLTDPGALLGEGRSASQQRTSAGLQLFGSYTTKELQLVIVVDDDKYAPFRATPGAEDKGDRLVIGAAREGGDTHVAARLDPSEAQPRWQPLPGIPPDAASSWSCQVLPSGKSTTRTYRLTIPARSLGADKLTAGQRLLLAARYVDDDADGFPPAALEWGQGLDDGRSTAQYRWVRLSGS